MKRLYFLCSNLIEATGVVEGFRAEGLEDDCIHVVGRDHHMLEEAKLHEATTVETTRLREGLDAGLVAGGSIGLLAGLAVIVTGPFGIALGGGTLLTSSLAGMGLGGWLGSLLGERRPDTDVRRYQAAIEEGQILVMADVRAERLPTFYQIIKRHCPNALVESFHLTHDHEVAA